MGLKVRSALDRASQDCRQRIHKRMLLQRVKRAYSDLPNICQSVSGISYCSSLSLLSTLGQISSMHAWHNAKSMSSWAKECESQPQCVHRGSIRLGVTRGIHTPRIYQRTSSSDQHATKLLVLLCMQILKHVAEYMCFSMARHSHLACQAVMGLS